MNGVIISNFYPEDGFKKFQVVPTTESALDWMENNSVDDETYVVLHQSDEVGDEVVCSNITKMYKKGITHFFYINPSPTGMISLCITGVGGVVMSDEYYLESEDELQSALSFQPLDMLRDNTALVRDFITAFSRGDEKVNSKRYVAQVSNAVDSLITEINFSNTALQKMSSGALETFKKVSDYCDKIKELQDKITSQLAQIQTSQNAARPVALGNNTVQLNPFTMTAKNNIIYFREYRYLPYVTTFMFSLHKFIKTRTTKKRAKLIFMCNKDINNFKKMASTASSDLLGETASVITKESMKNIGALAANSIIFTDIPIHEVMTQLVSKESADLFIIVDRLHQPMPLISGSFMSVGIYGNMTDMEFDGKQNGNKFKLENSIFVLPPKLPEYDNALTSLRTFDIPPATLKMPQSKSVTLFNAYRPSLEKVQKYFINTIGSTVN